MKVSATFKGVLKNMIKWVGSSLPIDLTNYNTNHQEHTTNNTGKAKNKLINQGVKTTYIHYYNTDQEQILSNIVTESDIYYNYSYNSCVNWEIEKTPENHSKKLQFDINKPETGLKKIDFNIIGNNNEIDDMNDNIIIHPSVDLADDVCSNINHHNIQQEQTNHNIVYILANNKLQLSSNLENLNEADGQKNTNSHKGELVIAYNTNAGNNVLRPRKFYLLYIGPTNDGNGHLIYKLSMNQILVTMKYQSEPVP